MSGVRPHWSDPGRALERLVATCLFPGFAGLEPPDWVRRRLADGLGGVVLYARNVESREQLAALTAALRAERADVLIAIDEEGGDVTRLEASAGSSYPGNAALGAADEVELTEQVAASLGADLREIGVNLDFAPVADVNTNPANPIIGVRSFGAEPVLVARHVTAFVHGLQGAGVAACAKHFPGHGDTHADSHLELPTVDLDRETFTAEALPPFRAAVDAGVQSIMTAHIRVPALDDVPATTSRAILHDLLREELGFNGMVMTDALEMRAISATVGVEEGAVQALAAGADALCLGHDLGDESVEGIMVAALESVRTGHLLESRLVEAADRIHGVADWASHTTSSDRIPVDVGRLAARRALRKEGTTALSGAPLVVELGPEPSIAAGKSPGPGEWLRRVLPEADVVRVSEDQTDLSAVENGAGRPLVIIARDAHRHEWQRTSIETLLKKGGEVVVVEVGLPHWRPAGAAGYIATYGAGRVNLEAAAPFLVG